MTVTTQHKYGWGATGFTFLVSALLIEWTILCLGFWEEVHGGHWNKIVLSMNMLIEGIALCVILLISR